MKNIPYELLPRIEDFKQDLNSCCHGAVALPVPPRKRFDVDPQHGTNPLPDFPVLVEQVEVGDYETTQNAESQRVCCQVFG
ncbi:MAG TPA: hypothetical protein VHE78_17195 [Gemmatimonadaceae bacterium]|nr:hypothetical protein [Gemmatimonadaceae bacterium]